MNVIPLSGDHGILMINIFSVPPENQQALVDAIRADGQDATLPGLLSRHLLRSEDGTQVAHCMHWASEDAFQHATSKQPVIRQIAEQVGALRAHPAAYQLINIEH